MGYLEALLGCFYVLQINYPNVEQIQTYDPVFILCFSVHSLLMGYIEPVEFASLGLLAIAFVSISSPHDEMRKLGYEALGGFKSALEVVLCSSRIAVSGTCYESCRIIMKFSFLLVLSSMYMLKPKHDWDRMSF